MRSHELVIKCLNFQPLVPSTSSSCPFLSSLHLLAFFFLIENFIKFLGNYTLSLLSVTMWFLHVCIVLFTEFWGTLWEGCCCCSWSHSKRQRKGTWLCVIDQLFSHTFSFSGFSIKQQGEWLLLLLYDNHSVGPLSSQHSILLYTLLPSSSQHTINCHLHCITPQCYMYMLIYR